MARTHGKILLCTILGHRWGGLVGDLRPCERCNAMHPLLRQLLDEQARLGRAFAESVPTRDQEAPT